MINNLVFEKINSENLDLAIKVQNEIFPEENGALNLKASTSDKLMLEIYGENKREFLSFYICRINNVPIGITGIYAYAKYPKDAWCGWFGILPKFQGKGYGKKLFLQTMKKAKLFGFINFYLYTDLDNNKTAVELYRKVGMIEESYTAEDMSPEKIVIFSKSLVSDKTEKWGNKTLFLKEQEKIQEKAKSFF